MPEVAYGSEPTSQETSMTTPTENKTEQTDQHNDTPILKEWGAISPGAAPKASGFVEHPEKRYRISPKRSLQSLIPPHSSLKMVMYVQRVDFIRDLFDVQGTNTAEVIVGDSIVTQNRSSTEPEVFLRLAELIADKRLKIRVPKRGEFHEKWILAENDEGFSDIFGTANLTSRGSGHSGKQSNQVRVNPISGDYKESPRYMALNKEYQEWYYDRSEPYLDDLVHLLQQEEGETPAIEVVERWITYTGAPTTGDSRLVQATIKEFQEAALKDSFDPDQLITTISTTANNAVLEEVVEILAPSGVQRDGRNIFATTRPFLQHRSATFPLMTIDQGRVILQVGPDSAIRTAEEYDREAIKNCLHGIHEYVETIDRASVKNAGIAKKTVYEVILYFLTAPFHHYFMRRGKEQFGWHYDRGPKPLAIYGNTKNGKTFLLRYCSKLLTGGDSIVEPLKDGNFKKKEIERLLSWGSLFPIIYDDISDLKWSNKSYMDSIGRNYWDNWWSNQRNHSQLILSSNRRVPQGQLKGRIKEVVMDARFQDETENIRCVSRILNKDNPIFTFFSKRYLEILDAEPDYYEHNDCMHLGRRVMRELYEMAELEIPTYFPGKPIEEIVDGNALAWLSMFHEGEATWEKTSQGELKIRLMNGEEGYEVQKSMDLIPESLGPIRSGKVIRIPVPSEFASWLRDSRSSFEVRWLNRKLRKLLRI